MLLPPTDRVTAKGGVAAVKAKPLHVLENANQRQTIARRLLCIGLERSLKPLAPDAKPRHRLPGSLVTKLRRPRPDDFPHHLARNPQLAADLLDRLPLQKIGPTYFGDRLTVRPFLVVVAAISLSTAKKIAQHAPRRAAESEPGSVTSPARISAAAGRRLRAFTGSRATPRTGAPRSASWRAICSPVPRVQPITQ